MEEMRARIDRGDAEREVEEVIQVSDFWTASHASYLVDRPCSISPETGPRSCRCNERRRPKLGALTTLSSDT